MLPRKKINLDDTVQSDCLVGENLFEKIKPRLECQEEVYHVKIWVFQAEGTTKAKTLSWE